MLLNSISVLYFKRKNWKRNREWEEKKIPLCIKNISVYLSPPISTTALNKVLSSLAFIDFNFFRKIYYIFIAVLFLLFLRQQ